MPSFDPVVLIVDPDAAARTALAGVIRRAGRAAETFAGAAELLARPPHAGPSCVVLELALPDADGVELVRRLAAERAAAPVVIVSRVGDVPTTVRAMKAGAIEFLPKPAADDAVLAAVGQALARSHALLREEAALLDLRARHDSLSVREREVMASVVAGLLNKQAGAVLGISEITVKAHRGSVMRKMRADSFAELVRMAIGLGLPLERAERIAPFAWSRGGDRSAPAVTAHAMAG